MKETLYQKIGITVGRLAQDLLTRQEGDRISSISEYQKKFQVSRGTIQNALNYLKDSGAITLVSRGHLGTFIETLDYRCLQECCFNRELLGCMPLPYSICYQGLATALYQALSPYAFNLFYARGAESRLNLLSTNVCQFAVCSRYAAEEAIRCHTDIQIAVDLGPGTYLTRHVLVFRDPGKTKIEPGMRIAYDRASLDHRHLTEFVTAGIPNVELVDLKAHRIVRSVLSRQIDAGIWNLDDILESGYPDLNVVPLPDFPDGDAYTSAVLVTNRSDENMAQLLQQNVDEQQIRAIQLAVRENRIPVDY